jgi:hypothetical protein
MGIARAGTTFVEVAQRKLTEILQFLRAYATNVAYDIAVWNHQAAAFLSK